jgi:hypothetical protein
VLTPATGLGDALVDRLRAAGLELTVSALDSALVSALVSAVDSAVDDASAADDVAERGAAQ